MLSFSPRLRSSASVIRRSGVFVFGPAWSRNKEKALKADVFVQEFARDEVPSYPCPSCGQSHLSVKNFLSEKNGDTKRNSGEEGWEPEYDEYLFSLVLVCGYCQETVFVSGDGYLDEEYDVDHNGNWSRHWVVKYRPKYFFPSLKFIDFPAATPKEVKENIDAASALFHAHPTASCNTLRIAAEGVLTSLGVPEPAAGEFISFGNRIKQLPQESTERTLLDAIRWLGNDGSHSKSLITHADAQDAFEVMNLLVEEVYSDRKRKIQELAKVINQHKGPVRLRGFRD